METNKSLDDIIAILCTLLHDVQDAHGEVFDSRSRIKTFNKVKKRLLAEGMGFLTKTLPRLGKAFDKALSGNTPLDATSMGFAAQRGTKLPMLFGELFKCVLQPNGALLEHPCAQCVRTIRGILYLFYKYELPYSDEQEQQVVSAFKNTEKDLSTLHPVLQALELSVANNAKNYPRATRKSNSQIGIARRAQILLSRIFASFDPLNIHPRHGPGSVATKQRLWGKYLWSNVASKITELYPLDAFFFASQGHVCDMVSEFARITDESLPARVCLVPKDSRGPRLISEEPVDFQWVQQGLGRAIVDHVEKHRLSRDYVHFTCQALNQIGALYGSQDGNHVTLDLKEASDRVSLELVRLLFPDHLYRYLEACRSSSTTLPNGEVLKLQKFAPMGSSLCFPILALTIWSLLWAGAPDADARDRILVYGDDVVVPKRYALNAISILESFGLLVNRDKSCLDGFFRESCGTDAFLGVNVTPVRLRTVWSHHPSPDVYTSWIAYANSFWDRRYYRTYDCIVGMLHRVYGAIPSQDMHLACPSLRYVPESQRPKRKRVNKSLQKLEFYARTIESPRIRKRINGWSMLLRFFAESGNDSPLERVRNETAFPNGLDQKEAFSVSQYTDRKSARLVWRWITVR